MINLALVWKLFILPNAILVLLACDIFALNWAGNAEHIVQAVLASIKENVIYIRKVRGQVYDKAIVMSATNE